MSDAPSALPSGSAAPRAEARVYSCVNCAYSLEGLPHGGNCPECGTPLSESLPPPLPTVVGDDRYCIQCAYALVGLSPTGSCPECGTSVALSLREPTLANAAPEYLRTLSSGLSFVLNGILLSIVATIGATILGAALASLAAMVVVQSLVLVVSVVIMLGYWKFTTPDPGQVAMEATNSARTIIRIVVPIQAGFALLHVGYTLVAHSATPGFGMLQIAGILLMLGAFVLQAIQFFGVMRYSRWLATRVPDFFIVRRTKTYMWLLPVIYVFGAIVLFLGPLFALIMYWNLLDRLRKHVKSILKTGRPARLKKMLPTGR